MIILPIAGVTNKTVQIVNAIAAGSLAALATSFMFNARPARKKIPHGVLLDKGHLATDMPISGADSPTTNAMMRPNAIKLSTTEFRITIEYFCIFLRAPSDFEIVPRPLKSLSNGRILTNGELHNACFIKAA